MRIRKDKDSWKAGGVLTRDARHDKSTREEPAPRRKPRSNRRQWCRGRVGVAHEPRWINDPRRNQAVYPEGGPMVFECQACCKQLDYWWGFSPKTKRPVIGSTEPLKKELNR